MSANSLRIYLDHNATSPPRPEVLDAVRSALEHAAHPASLHAEGRAARARLEAARQAVAELAGAQAGEVVFTSGGSEAIAAAIRGVCDRAPAGVRRIVASTIEHSAVLQGLEQAARRGFEIVHVACDSEGRVAAEGFVRHLGSDVALAVLHWANNETGVIQPVAEVGRACRRLNVAFLVDAVQAAGKIALDFRAARADLLALSGHKIGGPQGSGALVVREGIVLAPLIAGGAEERRRRGGTPAVAALAGFGAAARVALARLPSEAERLLRLRARIETRLRRDHPRLRLHGQAASRLPNTINFALPGVGGEILAIALDLAGVAVSTGSACASGAVEPSHVIRAMGFADAEARGAVRLSLGWNTTAEEVERFLALLPGLVERIERGPAAAAHPGA